MRVLVTGGTGVVGTSAVTALRARGHALRVLTRHADTAATDGDGDVEFWTGDVADAESIRGAAAGCDAVLHLVAIVDESPPSRTFESVNVAGTANVLAEAARSSVPRFVFVSSLGAEHGRSGYHASKRAAEALVGLADLDASHFFLPRRRNAGAPWTPNR